jgi:adenine-specific DNA-methyltransferase
MSKMKFETPDLTAANLAKLAELFPGVVAEGKLNVELLRTYVGEEIFGDEAYEFTWVGKRAAIAEAGRPIRKTLRPCPEESRDWDTTENLYIEGDNLDVLKLLQESYLGKVKMIYIDPPYNTGNDFIYRDNFTTSREDYEEEAGTYDEDGDRLFKNTETNGRFHSDWCSMMYPRLVLARNLLCNEGVLFVQIDDNEVETLGKLLNDVFGEDNFINIVTVKTKIGGVSGSSEGKSLKDATEFIWAYAKNKNDLQFNPVYIKTKLSDRIKSYEVEGKSWKYTSVMTKLDDKCLIKEDKVRGVIYYGYKTLETSSITSFARSKGITEEQVYDEYADRIFRTTNAQSSVRQTVIKETKGHDYPMYGCEYIPIKGKNEGQTIEVLYKSGSTDDQRNMMMFLSDVVEKIDGTYYYLDRITSLWDDIDYNNLTKEGDIEFANGKKPIKLLQRMLSLATDKDSLIMDFFSGSGSTAHAVMQQNIEDGGRRNFIVVQLPETAENTDFSTICDLAKERIRRAGDKIRDEAGLIAQDLDIGFRVLKLDDTNMNDVYYAAGDYTQDLVSQMEGNIKSDRTDMDLLFGCLLDWGLPLSMPHTHEKIDGFTVHTYNGGDLIACFEEQISETAIREIASRKPLRAVFRDSSFTSSPEKINVFEIFKLLAPSTKVRVI